MHVSFPFFYTYLPYSYLCFRQFPFYLAKPITKDNIVTGLLWYDPVQNLILVSDSAFLLVP